MRWLYWRWNIIEREWSISEYDMKTKWIAVFIFHQYDVSLNKVEWGILRTNWRQSKLWSLPNLTPVIITIKRKVGKESKGLEEKKIFVWYKSWRGIRQIEPFESRGEAFFKWPGTSPWSGSIWEVMVGMINDRQYILEDWATWTRLAGGSCQNCKIPLTIQQATWGRVEQISLRCNYVDRIQQSCAQRTLNKLKMTISRRSAQVKKPQMREGIQKLGHHFCWGRALNCS